jgi:transglutaminase-like putative cysteine protease
MSAAAPATPVEANLISTNILNHKHPAVKLLVTQLSSSQPSPRAFVQAAHRYLGEKMKAVYSIDEERPVSETLRLNAGSCGQRMAAVEALARGYGVPTRVRAVWLDRRFWNSRLPLLRFFLPRRTLMPWSQFYLDGSWVDLDELFGPIAELAANSPVKHAFTNRGESLFDAVRHTPVDFFGKLKGTRYASYDISRVVVEDGSIFQTRDELLAQEKKPGWLGRLLFNVLYGGRNIRRLAE